MSIKVKVVKEKKFKNGETNNMLHLNFKGKNVNYVLINTLRRTLLDLIPIHAFDPEDIVIKTNTSVYNNDIIRLRLSTFPLYEINNNLSLVDDINKIQNKSFVEESLDKLSIFFSKKNNGNDKIHLTTDDCEFYMGDKKIESIYKTPLLIVPLNPGQEVRGDCKSSVGIGLTSGIYQSVQICCYEEINETEYLLKLESRGQLTEKDLIKRACLVIENKINILKNKFSSNIIDGNKLELTIKNEDHTLGNLITYYLQSNKSVTYAGYRMDHPLKREIDLHLESNGSKKIKTIIIDTFDEIIDTFKKIRGLIKK